MLSPTPRVFSPSGSYATSQVAIGFSIARAGPVSVRVYDRAGRLVREVIDGQNLNAGVNVVRWDGRKDGGGMVEDGLYVVSIEALGQKQTRTLAVVR